MANRLPIELRVAFGICTGSRAVTLANSAAAANLARTPAAAVPQGAEQFFDRDADRDVHTVDYQAAMNEKEPTIYKLRDGATISAQVTGQVTGSGLPVMLVHGFPLDHSMWRYQVADLAADFQLIVPDLRGFGRSGPARGMMKMEDFADDLVQLLDCLKVERAVFAGLSMGGYVAWQFWKKYSNRLHSLIICDSKAAADSALTAEARRVMADRVRQSGPDELVGTMLPRLFATSTIEQQPAIVASVRAVMLNTNRETIASALEAMAIRVDMTEELPRIGVRSLLLVGEHDVISPVQEMKSMAEAIPNSQFAVIPDAGHMAPLERPQEVNQLLRKFLTSH